MTQAYEREPSGAGCIVAAVALVMFLVLGTAILGFVLVLPLLYRLLALVTSAPGAVMLGRAIAQSIRTRSSEGWRKAIYGSGLLALSLLAWAIIATFVAR